MVVKWQYGIFSSTSFGFHLQVIVPSLRHICHSALNSAMSLNKQHIAIPRSVSRGFKFGCADLSLMKHKDKDRSLMEDGEKLFKQ